MPASSSLRLLSLIERHRTLVMENEALYHTDGSPVGMETTASEERCAATLRELMAAPCLTVEDVAAKLMHLMDRSLRERGPVALDLYEDDSIGFFEMSSNPEADPFMAFLNSLNSGMMRPPMKLAA